MPKEAANTPRNEGKEPKRFTFTLSTAGVATLAVVSAMALAWIFILGVLVGRGYKPEQAVPQLAEIMPRAEAPKPEGVLKAEDLQFYEALEKKPGPDEGGSAPAKPKADKPTAPAKSEDKPAEAKPAAPAQAAPAAAKATTDGQFRYVYQVASLKSADMAKEYAAKLEKLGLSTSIEQAQASGTTWHRIMVHYTGTPESTDELKALLATQGVKKPIMKSKVPF